MPDPKETARRIGFIEPEIKHVLLMKGEKATFRGGTDQDPYIVEILVIETGKSQVLLFVNAAANKFRAEENVINLFTDELNAPIPLSRVIGMGGPGLPAVLRKLYIAFITPGLENIKPMAGGSIDVALGAVAVRNDDPPPAQPPGSGKKK